MSLWYFLPLSCEANFASVRGWGGEVAEMQSLDAGQTSRITVNFLTKLLRKLGQQTVFLMVVNKIYQLRSRFDRHSNIFSCLTESYLKRTVMTTLG